MWRLTTLRGFDRPQIRGDDAGPEAVHGMSSVGHLFAYRQQLYLLNTSFAVTAYSQVEDVWSSLSSCPRLGQFVFERPLAVGVHRHLLWVFLVGQAGPAAIQEVYLAWLDLRRHVWIPVLQHQSALPPLTKACSWSVRAQTPSTLLFFFPTRKFLDGPGPYLWSFDLLTCSWSKCAVEGASAGQQPVALAACGDKFYALTEERSQEQVHVRVSMLDVLSRRWRELPTGGAAPCLAAVANPSIMLQCAVVLERCWVVLAEQGHSNIFSSFDFKMCSWSPISTAGDRLRAPCRERQGIALGPAAAAFADNDNVRRPVLGGGGSPAFYMQLLEELTAPPSAQDGGSAAALALYCNSGALSDVTLVAGGERLPAHRLVLASQSLVFSRMFDNPMQESSTHEVHMEGLAANTVRGMLQHMYGLPTSIADAEVIPLFEAADQYEVRGLQERCLTAIRRLLAPEGVVDLLLLSDRHQSAALWDTCVAYAADGHRFADVLGSRTYLAAMTQHPQLVQRFARDVVSGQRQQ